MLRKIAFDALIVMIITMAFSLVAWSEPNPKQTKSQGKSGKLSAQRNTDKIKPADNIVTNQQLIDAISSAIDAAAQKAKTTQKSPPPDNSTFWFSLWLVIFTGGLVLVGIVQCYIIFNTLKETQVVAKAATDSAQVAEEALHVAEKAYLRIDSFELVNFTIGKHINVKYQIHNVGHTPAQIIESFTIVDIVEKDSFKTPVYDVERGFSGPKQAFIQPGGEASMIGISKEPVTPEEFDLVQNNSKLVFAWGKITFRDVFGKTWVNGFGTVFSQVFGITTMDGYNYTKEYDQNKEQL